MTALRPGHGGSEPPEPPGGAGPAGASSCSGNTYDPLTDPLSADPQGAPWCRMESSRSEQPAVQNPPQDWYAREAVYESVPEPVRDQPLEPPGQLMSESAQVPVTQLMPTLTGPVPDRETRNAQSPGPEPVFTPPGDNETVALRVPEAAAGRPASDQATPTGGRAERRKAAKGRGRKGVAPAEPVMPAIPRTRIEARRAARALKDSPAVIASRAIGEIFISLGVLMLLFVTYQLWWTNVRADEEANGTAHSLQEDWAKGGNANQPGVFEPGQGFAIIHIPKLDVVVPIAEGVGKHEVLDRGMVGHYSEGKLKTAMPSARTGNFALAGHRNTHGEPFRYINKLKNGDKVIVETRDDYYTYEVTSHLAQTSPSNVSVITPVPPGSGFTGPGRYITLTTCTPEFTSTYRMVVWGKMVDERPRSKGLPEALTAG